MLLDDNTEPQVVQLCRLTRPLPSPFRSVFSPPTKIDVMILYSTDALLNTVEGQVTAERMESVLPLEITYANQAMENSQVDLRFNLVHVGPVSA